MAYLYLLLLLTSAGGFACLIITTIVRGKFGRSRGFYIAMGIGAQFFLSIPAGLIQGFALIPWLEGHPPPLRALVALIGSPFNTGGLTARFIFEKLTGPVTPVVTNIRASTAISYYHIYLSLLALQVFAAASFFAHRMRSRRDFRDPAIYLLGAAILVNSILNVRWPWWLK